MFSNKAEPNVHRGSIYGLHDMRQSLSIPCFATSLTWRRRRDKCEAMMARVHARGGERARRCVCVTARAAILGKLLAIFGDDNKKGLSGCF